MTGEAAALESSTANTCISQTRFFFSCWSVIFFPKQLSQVKGPCFFFLKYRARLKNCLPDYTLALEMYKILGCKSQQQKAATPQDRLPTKTFFSCARTMAFLTGFFCGTKYLYRLFDLFQVTEESGFTLMHRPE